MGALAVLRKRFEEYIQSRGEKDRKLGSDVDSLRDEVRRLKSTQFQGGSNQVMDTLVQELREKGEAQLQEKLAAVIKEELPDSLRAALADFDLDSWLRDVDLSNVASDLAAPIVKLLSEGGGFGAGFIRALVEAVYNELDLDTIEEAVVDRLVENLTVRVSLNDQS